MKLKFSSKSQEFEQDGTVKDSAAYANQYYSKIV